MQSLQKLIGKIKEYGATRIFFKMLSANDNSKQQIYLGGNWDVLSILPYGEITSYPYVRQPNFKAPVTFYWMNEYGQISLAPKTQLILYPKYPEIRLSGFLNQCPTAPSQHMQATNRMEGRVLILATRPDRSVIGYLLLPNQNLTKELLSAQRTSVGGVINELAIERDALSELFDKIALISSKGFIPSKRLGSDGKTLDYYAENGGGYTLEAELGIVPNGYSEPDFRGIEVKQYGIKRFDRAPNNRITLMTPEPIGGIYQDSGLVEFMLRFSHDSKPGEKYFTGSHKFGAISKKTGLMLALIGHRFSPEGKFEITDLSGGIVLIHPHYPGEIVALWSYSQILDHWRRKHSRSVYIPSICREIDGRRSYQYSSQVWFGDGTNPIRFFDALIEQKVFYDPATKIYLQSGSWRSKKRNQFRIHFKNLYVLYNSFTQIDALRR